MQGMVTIVLTQKEQGAEVDVKSFFAPRLDLEGENPDTHIFAVKMLNAAQAIGGAGQ